MKNQNEGQLRRKLASQGFSLSKSRVQKFNADNLGGYMIIDSNNNSVITGKKYNLTLEDVELFVNDSD